MRGQDREGEKCPQGQTRQDHCRAESETGCEDAEGRGGEQGIQQQQPGQNILGRLRPLSGGLFLGSGPRKSESFQTHVSEGPGLHRAGSTWVWESQLLQAGSSRQPAWVPSAALLSGSLGERAMLLAKANKTPSTNWDPSAMRGDLSLLSQGQPNPSGLPRLCGTHNCLV